MKTIKQAKEEYSDSLKLGDAESVSKWEFEMYAQCDFEAGVAFAQRWIPVEDELPEEGALVFAKSGNEPIDIDICWFKNKKFIMRFAYQPSYYSSTVKFRENITESITHWRPIEYR